MKSKEFYKLRFWLLGCTIVIAAYMCFLAVFLYEKHISHISLIALVVNLIIGYSLILGK